MTERYWRREVIDMRIEARLADHPQRHRGFCRYCGVVVEGDARECARHRKLRDQDPHFSTQSTGLSTKQAAPRREAIAPQIGADPA